MAQHVDRVGAPERHTDGPHQATSPSTTTRTTSKRWWHRPWILPLVVLNSAFLLFVLPPYLNLDRNEALIGLAEDFPLHYPILVLHIVFGTTALVTLCLQVWPWLRQHHPAVHRISGRIYVLGGAIPSALLALVLAPFAAVPIGILGGATAGVLWLVTSVIGFHMARRRRYTDHRRWMIYSFAFALQTIWGRILVITTQLTGLEIDPIVLGEAGGWLGWIFNLFVAQWWLERTARRRSRLPA